MFDDRVAVYLSRPRACAGWMAPKIDKEKRPPKIRSPVPPKHSVHRHNENTQQPATADKLAASFRIKASVLPGQTAISLANKIQATEKKRPMSPMPAMPARAMPFRSSFQEPRSSFQKPPASALSLAFLSAPPSCVCGVGCAAPSRPRILIQAMIEVKQKTHVVPIQHACDQPAINPSHPCRMPLKDRP